MRFGIELIVRVLVWSDKSVFNRLSLFILLKLRQRKGRENRAKY